MTKIEYEYVSSYSEGAVCVRLNNKEFHNCEGVACVRLGDKQFHIDKQGNRLYPQDYDWVEDYYDGVACVKLGGEKFCIDKQGNRVEEENG